MRLAFGRTWGPALYSARALAPYTFQTLQEKENIVGFARDFIPSREHDSPYNSMGELRDMLLGKMPLNIKGFHLYDYERFKFAIRFFPHMEFHRKFVAQTLKTPELWSTAYPVEEMKSNTYRFARMMRSLKGCDGRELHSEVHKMFSDSERIAFLEANARQQFSDKAVSRRIELFHHICLGWNMSANIAEMEARDVTFFIEFAENTIDFLHGEQTRLPGNYGLDSYDTEAVREAAIPAKIFNLGIS